MAISTYRGTEPIFRATRVSENPTVTKGHTVDQSLTERDHARQQRERWCDLRGAGHEGGRLLDVVASGVGRQA